MGKRCQHEKKVKVRENGDEMRKKDDNMRKSDNTKQSVTLREKSDDM